ncbi:hypothetical protein L1049_025230 [Liquidambar formosana]|uniref:Uncharacterized protein n=1 Tax=Liquidambar formosana TaxID=63359 RepID=A0AAP0X0D1_LIQFO
MTPISPVATRGMTGKRKRDHSDKSSGHKRKNPGLLPFFNNIATEVDDNDRNDHGNNILFCWSFEVYPRDAKRCCLGFIKGVIPIRPCCLFTQA